MYHKHKTEGIIIGSSEKGEASRVVVMLTREFGLVYASVQNGRSINSKLRFNTQDLMLGEFSLVRGKHSWKLVGAREEENLDIGIKEREAKLILVKIFSLIKKLYGEEKNEKLYETVLDLIKDLKIKKQEELNFVESLFVLKILKQLGYLAQNEGEIENLAQNRTKSVEVINLSLRATGLIT